jgi:hypothetical protein
MSTPKLEGVRLFRAEAHVELILDFDNDRHHLVKVRPGADALELASAFHDIADALAHDPKLKG